VITFLYTDDCFVVDSIILVIEGVVTFFMQKYVKTLEI